MFASLNRVEIQGMTIRQIIDAEIFKYNEHYWELVADIVGWTLYRNNSIYRQYAARVGVSEDIKSDILGPQINL